MTSNIFNFVGQLLLIKIFYQFGKPTDSPRRLSTNSKLSRSNKSSDCSMKSGASGMSQMSNFTNNKEAEMKARIWNQFMRTSREIPGNGLYADPSILSISEHDFAGSRS